MSNTKYYPNPNRNQKVELEPYVPQYQLHGIDPTPVRGFGGFVPSAQPPKQNMTDPSNNPRIRSMIPAVPYATDGSSEGDDEFYDQGYSEESFASPQIQANSKTSTWNFSRESSYDVVEDVVNDEDLNFGANESKEESREKLPIKEMPKDSYVLIFEDNILCVGDLSTVEPIIYDLLIGSHELANGRHIEIDEIVLLKRVGVKFGLFFED